MSIKVLDDHVPEQFIDAALASVLPVASNFWTRGSVSAGDNKIGRDGPTYLRLGPDHPSIKFMVESCAGIISPAYVEPHADMSYAGLFQMLPGAKLSPHRDFNTVPNMRWMRRRLGIVLFLNDPDGGNFELWDARGITNAIQPVRNRMVMFDVDRYHGVSTVGEGSRRLTLAFHVCSKITNDDPEPHEHMTWLADQPENPFQKGTS